MKRKENCCWQEESIRYKRGKRWEEMAGKTILIKVDEIENKINSVWWTNNEK